MSLITYQPHHVPIFLLVYVHKWDKDAVIESYQTHSDEMRQLIKTNMDKVLNNPQQQIGIVSSLDSLCSPCPYNINGTKYDPSIENICSLGNGNPIPFEESEDYFWSSKVFKFNDILDKNPISAQEFLNKVKNYDRKYDFEIIMAVTNL